MGLVVAGRHGVEIFSVDLEAVKASIIDELVDEVSRVRPYSGDSRTQIVGVPLGDLAARAVFVEQGPVRVLFVDAAPGIGR